MDIYRAGEALLRSSQPLLPFLAPAAYKVSRRAPIPVARHCRVQRQTSRTFTTTQCRHQEEQRDRRPSTTLSKASGVTDDISSILDSTLDLNKGVPTAPTSQTSRFSSQDAQRRTSASRAIADELAQAKGGSNRSSVDDLLDSMLGGRASHISNSNRQKSSRFASSDIMSMLDPNGAPDGAPPAANLDKEPVELPKNVGRIVEVDEKRNMDVGRAFRTMEMRCARNSVRRDFQKQRFHERPGLKRKRLRRERWAKRFKASFVGTVQMVQRMRRQGW